MQASVRYAAATFGRSKTIASTSSSSAAANALWDVLVDNNTAITTTNKRRYCPFSTPTRATTTTDEVRRDRASAQPGKRREEEPKRGILMPRRFASYCSAGAPVLERRPLSQHRQQVRSMVMVTKTSSVDLPPPQPSSTAQTTNATVSAAGESPEVAGQEGEVLHITTSCTDRIKQLASKRPHPESTYLRVYVDAGGCSGFQYKFEIEDESDADCEGIDEDDDVVLTVNGTRIVVDRESLQLLQGSTIDYVQEMIRSSFAVVENPQSETACGCGSSFAVKNFQSNPALD